MCGVQCWLQGWHANTLCSKATAWLRPSAAQQPKRCSHFIARPHPAGGAQQVLGLGATKLPAWVWHWLPPKAALALRTAARSYTESRLLPVIAVGGITAAGSPLLPRPGHRKVGSLGGGVGTGTGAGLAGSLSAGLGGSAESLESPKFRTHSGSPRRAPPQLQTAGSAGLSSLGRPSLEPGALPGGFVQQSPLGAHPAVAVPSTPHAH